MNLIFDFDGTISDSLETLLEVINPKLRLLRRGEITPEEVRSKGTLQLLEEHNIPKILLPFIVIHGRWELGRLIPNLKPFDNMETILKQLSQNHTLGIVTSNSTKTVNQFLDNNSLNRVFNFVNSSLNYYDKSARITKALSKHNLKAKDSYFITDETRDIKAAQASKVKTVAVTWGLEDVSIITKSNPDHIIDNPQKLLTLFD